MRMIVEAFKESLELGLAKHKQVVVSVSFLDMRIHFISTSWSYGYQPMIPTYVFGWPTGQEKGNYLAVDLGEYTPVSRLEVHVPILPSWYPPHPLSPSLPSDDSSTT